MKKLTTEEFLKRASKVHKTYDFSKFIYLGATVKGIVICPKHGMFNSSADKLVNSKQGCPNCGGSMKLDTQIFNSRIKKIHPDYKLDLVEYKNHYEKVKIICPSHGVFLGTPTHLLQGVGCPNCGGSIKSNTLEFIEKIKHIHKKYQWDLINYKNNTTKVEVICPDHGVFKASPANLLRGKGCHRCNESKGEKFIAQWLEDNSYYYTPQKRFDTCKYKNKLPFDFHINDSNILIEYDGEQHFKPVKFWNGLRGLKNIIKRDNIKNNWAKNNKFILIRLNYLMNFEEKIKILEAIKNYMPNCIVSP